MKKHSVCTGWSIRPNLSSNIGFIHGLPADLGCFSEAVDSCSYNPDGPSMGRAPDSLVSFERIFGVEGTGEGLLG